MIGGHLTDSESGGPLLLANMLLPRFGIFGSASSVSLKLPVAGVIDELSITLKSPEPEFLILQRLRLVMASGNELPWAELVADVDMSSDHYGELRDNHIERAVSGELLHTKKEVRPRVRIRLSRPIHVDWVEIWGRYGVADQRNRHLMIEASLDREIVSSLDHSDPKTMMDEMLNLLASIDCPIPVVDESTHTPDVVSGIRSSIVAAIESGSLDWDARRLAQLLAPYSPQPTYDEFQEIVCAGMVLAMLKNKKLGYTADLKFISNYLSTGERIMGVSRAASQIAQLQRLSRSEVVISKHAIHFSFLSQHRDKYLRALDKVFSVFDSLGCELMLCYGTLLGAVRQGEFLGHDDDVDLLYVDRSKTFDEAMNGKKALLKELAALGLAAWGDCEGKNFHITINGADLDIFPCWTDGENVVLLMEGMNYRGISRSLMLPCSKVTLHGREYPAPANPAGFLLERYGPGWSVPDPFHEWPWSVARDT